MYLDIWINDPFLVAEVEAGAEIELHGARSIFALQCHCEDCNSCKTSALGAQPNGYGLLSVSG
jgi:hypothetical protein